MGLFNGKHKRAWGAVEAKADDHCAKRRAWVARFPETTVSALPALFAEWDALEAEEKELTRELYSIVYAGWSFERDGDAHLAVHRNPDFQAARARLLAFRSVAGVKHVCGVPLDVIKAARQIGARWEAAELRKRLAEIDAEGGPMMPRPRVEVPGQGTLYDVTSTTQPDSPRSPFLGEFEYERRPPRHLPGLNP